MSFCTIIETVMVTTVTDSVTMETVMRSAIVLPPLLLNFSNDFFNFVVIRFWSFRLLVSKNVTGSWLYFQGCLQNPRGNKESRDQ